MKFEMPIRCALAAANVRKSVSLESGIVCDAGRRRKQGEQMRVNQFAESRKA